MRGSNRVNMKHRTFVVALIVAVLAALAVPATAAASRTYWAQGWSGSSPVYRAKTLQVSGDSTYFMRHMSWSRWGRDIARGHGKAAVDDCDPNCAEGTFHTYPVRVRLKNPKKVCGHRFFTTIVIVYTDRHPAGIPKRDVRSYTIVC